MSSDQKDINEAFIEACRSENIDRVRQILENRSTNGVDINYIKGYLARNISWLERAPIHWACEKNNLQLLIILLENGANPDIQNSQGKTPLHLASMQLAQLLFQFRANCNLPDYNGNTPLHYACDKFTFNSDKKIELIQLYVANGADVNQRNSQGKTPFFVSCDTDNIDIVRFLISEIHVDVNIPDNEGNTPLHSACSLRNLEIIQILLFETNANTNIRNNNGLTPIELVQFHIASIRNNLDYAQENFHNFYNLDNLEQQFQEVIEILESKQQIQDSASMDALQIHDLVNYNKKGIFTGTPREQVLTTPELARNVRSYLSKPRSVYERLLGPQLYTSFAKTAKSLFRPHANAGVVATRRSHSGKSNSGKKNTKGGKRKMKKTTNKKNKKL